VQALQGTLLSHLILSLDAQRSSGSAELFEVIQGYQTDRRHSAHDTSPRRRRSVMLSGSIVESAKETREFVGTRLYGGVEGVVYECSASTKCPDFHVAWSYLAKVAGAVPRFSRDWHCHACLAAARAKAHRPKVAAS
jgi:hypothetical protein